MEQLKGFFLHILTPPIIAGSGLDLVMTSHLGHRYDISDTLRKNAGLARCV